MPVDGWLLELLQACLGVLAIFATGGVCLLICYVVAIWCDK